MTYWIIIWPGEGSVKVATSESERDQLIKSLCEDIDPEGIDVYESQAVYRVAMKLEKI